MLGYHCLATTMGALKQPHGAPDKASLCVCPRSCYWVVQHPLLQLTWLDLGGTLSPSAAGDSLVSQAPIDVGSTAKGLPHGLQAVKYSQLAASCSPVRGTPMMASSAVAQSPSIQVDFNPIIA